jgi:predicted CXXCH cytochrome family protein
VRISHGLALGLLAAIFIPIVIGASAQEAVPGVSNETCLGCHAEPSISMPLLNGELMSLFIDPESYASSVHGEGGYACVQCHTGVGDYPHPAFQAEDRRDLSIQLYTACQRCHSGEYERTLDSAHEQARQSGILDAAVCTDCHGAHDTKRLTDSASGELLPDSRTWIPTTCARCHNAIFEKYLTSVHGAALVEDANTDVPTCIDCHGVHDIEDPRTTSFRLQSPQLCAGCHTDETLMAAYGLSTDVLETYVADFHGTTVTLFEKQSPDAETNKPVCFDCHGVHDIKRTDDPLKGLQVRENMLTRCQVCHPDASASFPDAWLSHYIPTADRHPLVYAVDTFYKFFIPTVLGGMGVIVALDFTSRLRAKLRTASDRQSSSVTQPEGRAYDAIGSPLGESPVNPSEQPGNKDEDGDKSLSSNEEEHE